MIMNSKGGMVVDHGCWLEKTKRSITPQKMMNATAR